MTSMTTKTRSVVKPASCESQRIQFSYQDTDGSIFTNEVVRSYTVRPVSHPQSKSDQIMLEDEQQAVPVMEVNQSKNLVKSVAPQGNSHKRMQEDPQTDDLKK